jgi:hypothetical protein
MSDRKLFGLFSGTHLTVLTCAAVLASSAAYGVSVTSVAITDPSTGKQSLVDNGRRLSTYDQIAGYTNNPAFAVNISDFSYSSLGLHTIYTIPAGKVLVIKSALWSYYGNTEGSNNYTDIYNSSSRILIDLEGSHTADTIPTTFDAGVIAHAGALSLYYGGPGYANTFIQGYLIPAGVAPVLGTAEAAEQFVTTGRQPAPGRR